METYSTGEVVFVTIAFTIFGIMLLWAILTSVRDRMNFVSKHLRETNSYAIRNNQKLETIYTMVDNRFDTVIRKLDLVEQIAMNNQAKLDRVNNSAY